MNRGSVAKPILIGCGIAAAIAVIVIVGLVIWLVSGPESGVKMANEMDKYALDYISQHNLLNSTEQLIAYYDVTMSMDGTEAAILTTERVMYHKSGQTTAIPLTEVVNVRHRYESLTGDIIEVAGRSGRQLKIEIAPLNQGESFYNALMDAWRAAGGGPRTSFD